MTTHHLPVIPTCGRMPIFVREALCIRYQTPCTDGGSGDFLVQGRTLRPFPPLVLFREKLVREASGFDAEKQNIRVLLLPSKPVLPSGIIEVQSTEYRPITDDRWQWE